MKSTFTATEQKTTHPYHRHAAAAAAVSSSSMKNYSSIELASSIGHL